MSASGSVDILKDMVDPTFVRVSLRVGTVNSMAEVGLVRFARVAMEIAEAVLPSYRSKFSKHTFTQPQLLAVLCVMRHEDWTLPKAQVRLAEHGELPDALGLPKAPDHTTLYRFLRRRLDERALVAALRMRASGACPSRATMTKRNRQRPWRWTRPGWLRAR